MEGTRAPVLLVDDRRANLDALEAILRSDAYELVSVGSGPEALEQLDQKDFAVVLLDVQMPTMDGIATARHMGLRAGQFDRRRTPIIFVTANDTDRSRILEAYAAGAADLIQKPLEPEVLRAKVAVFAELFRTRTQVKDVGEKLERQQKGAEEQAKRFRLLVETVKDYAIFMLDPNGYVATWNAGAERINGYAAHEIIGKHFGAFYPPEEVAAGKCDRELEVATREGRFEEEGWRVRKDGSRLWANVTITALRDRDSGELVGFAKVTRDLTERIEHEATLRTLAAEKATLAEKARIQEFQERFIAILGHDLRNPLAAIDMGVTLLSKRAEEVSDDSAARVLDRMKASTRRMSRMIEQVLDLTRSRLAGGLAIKPATMNLCTTITSIADELRTAHPSRRIEVSCSPSVIGGWDADRLEQVFSNLVSNAVHYGLPDRPVSVRVEQAGPQVVVTVHNEGPPIAEKTMGEIFSPFRRGERDSRTVETAGLGLGLYISREIVLAHGGDIAVESTKGGGTTFRVTLPGASPDGAVVE